jgi:glutaredoxin
MAAPAGWVDMQEKAFTRWCNEKLKVRGLHINNFSKDLCDGLLLCNLLEIISNKSLGRINKNPVVPMQKLENCSIALNFLKSENIKLVNIGPEDIVDGRQKLLLGLIWTIILRYQIQGMNEGEGEGRAKSDLLEWIRKKIPEYNIQNFTKDWNDGRAICGLVHALDPSLCPDHRQLDPGNALQNATKGVDTALNHLNVPPIVEPAEMVNPKVDEHSMMTYLSIFRDLDNQGAFKKRLDDAQRCQAFGDGLTDGVVGQQSEFTIKVPPNCRGKLEVKVEGPKTKVQPVVTKNPDGSYNVTYTPTEAGTWRVHVTLDGVHIPGSVFTVTVLERESLGGEGKIRVFYSTTTAKNEITRPLQELLEKKGIHLRPDFEPWIPVDIMTREDRELVFRLANTRKLPIVYIDDKVVGSYDEMFALEKSGELDRLLKVVETHYKDLYGPGKRSQYLNTSTPSASAPAPAAAPRAGGSSAATSAVAPPPPVARPTTGAAAPKSPRAGGAAAAAPAPAPAGAANFCPSCGTKASGKFCSKCGQKL